jgi:hypothetical protein
MNAVEAMPLAFIGFSSIAAITWFFSYQPRLFVRVFVPRDEFRGAIHAFIRDPSFGRNMRMMSLLQFGVASVFGLIGLCLWFGR